MANIGRIAGGGFDLIRRRPGAVLAWGAIYVTGSVALGYAQSRLIGPDGPAIDGQTGPGSFALHGLGIQLVFGLLSLALSSILSAAVFRAVLWPGERGLASIRLGMDEARLIGLTLIVYVLALIGGVVIGLGMAFVTTLIGFLFGGSTIVASVLGPLVILGVIGLFVFLLVRLSVVYPLVLVRRRISLDAGWDLTRGHFWSLLGAYVLIGLMITALLFLAFLPLVVLGITLQFQGTAFWPQLFEQLRGGESAWLAASVAVMAVLGPLVCGIMLALGAGGTASAVKDLLSHGGAEREPVPSALD